MSQPDVRERVLGLLQRHGWNATSFQILEPGFSYWFDGDDAVVGYVDTGGAWVAAAPVAEPARLGEVAARFSAAAARHARRACCFATEEQFHERAGWRSLRIGDQPVWRPADWSEVVRRKRSLREQLRRARAKGVTVRALAPEELAPGHPIRHGLERMIERWLADKPMAPMGFLVQIDPFVFPSERRCFVATVGEDLVGFLGVIPIYARRGWFFEDFLRDPAAPNGTVELLVDAGMRAAVEEGVEEVTLGLVPLAGEVDGWLRTARRWGRALYDFDGLRAFKAKLEPRAWEPIYLAHPPGTSSLRAVVDALTAFARGGLLRFGLETVLRGPALVLHLLATLLVMWTVVLALPASGRWFPSAAWQYGWVAFDVLVASALFALGRRWRHGLATTLAAAVTADAGLTALQAATYNLPHRTEPADVVVIAIAVAAPAIAAVLLWKARGHHARRARRAGYRPRAETRA